VTHSYFLPKDVVASFNEQSEQHITKRRKMLDATVEVGLAVSADSLLMLENMLVNHVALNLGRLEEYLLLVYDPREACTCGQVLTALRLDRDFLKLWEQIQTSGVMDVDLKAAYGKPIFTPVPLELHMSALANSFTLTKLIQDNRHA